MLCIECGKREAKYEGLCEECFLKKVKFTDLPGHMEIVRCPHCGAVKFKGEWRRMEEDDIIRELIERNMDVLHDCDSIHFDFNVREENDGKLVDVLFHIKYEDLEVDEEHVSEVLVKYESCPRCNRYFGNYFEAILQIRGLRDGELHDIVNFAHERLAFYAQKNENLFITKEEGKHGGWDIYISDKREAKKVADEMCRKYGATLKSSPHIVGRKDGKDVYRMTYSVRLPEYREGDVVEMQSKYYLVEHVSSHYVKMISLDDGKEKSVDVRKHEIRVIKKRDELEEAMVIFSQGNEVQVMDGDYRTLEAISYRKHRSGERVKIIRTENMVYVI
ncbi:NMD protein affecting ribosome stability and mRNA decay [Aciduliprofundum sp. MAR08-339]|uniref:60S ribosomal export protein NMD3 n=1 Tax=Aciduliprofundum sp. (strain MAR08-339) TaxID=673860 RepID=UPI0002A48914|nr:NMD protein affecting ribosome stability and mRNA decay [Aciduliprofundum sp. MAR08-339]